MPNAYGFARPIKIWITVRVMASSVLVVAVVVFGVLALGQFSVQTGVGVAAAPGVLTSPPWAGKDRITNTQRARNVLFMGEPPEVKVV